MVLWIIGRKQYHYTLISLAFITNIDLPTVRKLYLMWEHEAYREKVISLVDSWAETISLDINKSILNTIRLTYYEKIILNVGTYIRLTVRK